MNEKKQKHAAADFPIRLTGERVWRTYLGGKLIDEMHGVTGGDDGHFPEEWIASLVSARNAGREGMEEGMSKLAGSIRVGGQDCFAAGTPLKDIIESAPEAYLGREHARTHGTSMGVLVKLIDAAERLTVQVHPDREKARELFQSDYGKTECWHILGGREVNGESPCVYLGFREGVDRAMWKELFDRQDLLGMLDCMHRFDASPGDTILIEGGIPHAIGAGCFLVEIQEPTDYTVRVERTTPSGFQVDDFLCHQGLGFDKMFDCFHYGGLTKEETRNRWFIPPDRECGTHTEAAEQFSGVAQNEDDRRSSGVSVVSLIGERNTSFFSMNMVTIEGFDADEGVDRKLCQREVTIPLPPVFSGLYVLDGEGQISASGRTEPIRKGEQFFLPAQTEAFSLKSAGGQTLRTVHFFGPQ